MTGTTSTGKAGNTVPDILDDTMVGEIKNRLFVNNTRQLQLQVSVAEKLNVPFRLFISPRTRRVANSVKRAVQGTGGSIERIDPVTKTATQVFP